MSLTFPFSYRPHLSPEVNSLLPRVFVSPVFTLPSGPRRVTAGVYIDLGSVSTEFRSVPTRPNRSVRGRET